MHKLLVAKLSVAAVLAAWLATSSLHLQLIAEGARSPVILIPGFEATQLQAKIDLSHKYLHWWCWHPPPNVWLTVWRSLVSLLPPHVGCLMSLLQQTYDRERHISLDAQGVKVRPLSMNSTDSVYNLDSLPWQATQYYKRMIDRLVNELGYKPQADLWGAGYDWRHGPNQLSDGFFVPLCRLIEHIRQDNSSTSSNNTEPVTLICHSMGCQLLLLFLDQQSSEWRQANVKRCVTLSSTFLGTIDAISGTLLGDADDVTPWPTDALALRPAQRTWPSLAFRYPNWSANDSEISEKVVVVTSDYSFTLRNISLLFDTLNLDDFSEMYNETRQWSDRVRSVAPQIESWCLHGAGLPTIEQIDASNSTLAQLERRGSDVNPTIRKGPGDGKINERSLSWCREWPNKQSASFHYKTFNGTSHGEIVKSDTVIDYIIHKILSHDIS